MSGAAVVVVVVLSVGEGDPVADMPPAPAADVSSGDDVAVPRRIVKAGPVVLPCAAGSEFVTLTTTTLNTASSPPPLPRSSVGGIVHVWLTAVFVQSSRTFHDTS